MAKKQETTFVVELPKTISVTVGALDDDIEVDLGSVTTQGITYIVVEGFSRIINDGANSAKKVTKENVTRLRSDEELREKIAEHVSRILAGKVGGGGRRRYNIGGGRLSPFEYHLRAVAQEYLSRVMPSGKATKIAAESVGAAAELFVATRMAKMRSISIDAAQARDDYKTNVDKVLGSWNELAQRRVAETAELDGLL